MKRVRRTKAELEDERRAIEWKAALYGIADDLLREAKSGDPIAKMIVAKTAFAPLLSNF